jgi:hypothetical protein
MRLVTGVLSILLFTGCASTPPATDPTQAFLANLAAHCGKAFAGRVIADEPTAANSPFANQPIVVHVRTCAPERIEMPLHVGADRSRTWIVQRTASGLTLAHDHRHQDGHPDKVSPYGGATAARGTATRQSFPVDAASIALFRANGLEASTTNTWHLEIEPGSQLAYVLTRPSGRHFRVEFDLTRPVPLPPPAWGRE